MIDLPMENLGRNNKERNEETNKKERRQRSK